MHRSPSSLSDYSATSSAAPGSRRPRAVPGGPRNPSTKASLSSILLQAHLQQQSQPQQQRQQQQQQQVQRQHRQSQNELPPSYVQSQHDVQAHTHTYTQTQRPRQSYTPPPTSAVASDSSCSHPPMSIFTRADTPSSVSAFSPVRTMSPAPVLEPHAEEPPAHRSPRQASRPLPPPADVTPKGEARTQSSTRSNPSIPLKPPTPSPDSPVSASASTSAYTKPRKMGPLTPQPLQHPPSVDFSSVAISWKALTLDAAQWTFSSAELQAIVSGAIRASAEPTSIRLLPLQTINEDLAKEIKRLESERAQANAQYRFTMYRRTMLLQSLNAASGSSTSPLSATSFSTNTINLPQTPIPSPVTDLAQRLAEVSITLDRLAETLVRVSDQLAQIRSLQDVHAASALAVALRKLNASYARRTREAQSLKEKLEATEAERDEAWRVAEELAMECDHDEELGEVIQGNVVNGEHAVATFTRASTAGATIKTTGVGPRVRHSEDEAEVDAPDEPGDESTIVPRRRRANSATTRVSAARTRSIRTSKASLRFPRSHESRPPSSYSQHSAHSGPSRARSRSRAGSTVGSPIDAPTPDVPNAPNEAIPDVPKVPNAVELARLVSVKNTASAPSVDAAASSTLPPMPPPPIETSPTKIGSFLDMVTRPNSATDVKGKSPERANVNVKVGTDDTGLESNAQDDETLRSGGAQVNGAEAVVNGHIDGDEQPINDEAGISRDRKVDETQILNVPPSPQIHHQIPHSASQVEASSMSELSEEVAIAKKQMQTRPSLHIYPASWTRPPPDSPMDVSRRSDPHRADDEDDDLSDEAELADAFESAYAQTQARGLAGYRGPLRVQHAQSLLPFPGTENRGRASFLGTTYPRPAYADNGGGMKRSPASDNVIERRGPFRGTAVSASVRRPTSLPSAQGEKPWNYF